MAYYNLYKPGSSKEIIATFTNPGLYCLAEILLLAASSDEPKIKAMTENIEKLYKALMNYIKTGVADKPTLDAGLRGLIKNSHSDRLVSSALNDFFKELIINAAYDHAFQTLLVEVGAKELSEGRTVSPAEIAARLVFQAATFLTQIPDEKLTAEEEARVEEIKKEMGKKWFSMSQESRDQIVRGVTAQKTRDVETAKKTNR